MPTWWRCGARTAPIATPQVKKPAAKPPAASAELDVAGGGDGGVPRRDRRRRLPVFHQARTARQGSRDSLPASNNAAPIPAPAIAIGRRRWPLHRSRRRQPRRCAARDRHPSEQFSAETVPFVTDRTRLTLANEYVAGGRAQGVGLEHERRRSALSSASRTKKPRRVPRSNSARSAPMQSSRRVNASSMRSAAPWFIRMAGRRCRRCRGSSMTPSIEKPFARSEHAAGARSGQDKAREQLHARPRRRKAIAVGPGGQFLLLHRRRRRSPEAVRRTLETCGAVAGVPCMIVALDDVFVVPVPTTMKATGFFRAGRQSVRLRAMREMMWRASSRRHRPAGMRSRSVPPASGTGAQGRQ